MIVRGANAVMKMHNISNIIFWQQRECSAADYLVETS
jgi:hypothetical protein